MSLFDSLTGPKWQHKSPDVRLAAIEQIDDESILIELVKNDPEPRVQASALAHINNSSTLDDLLDTLSGELHQQAKTQRLEQLLPPGDPQVALKTGNFSEDELHHIMRLTDSEKVLSAVVIQFGNEAAWLDLASTHPLAKVRLIAAEQIENPALLEELMQSSRERDKGVYRHCKTVLDELHATEQARLEQEALVEQLTQKAVSLSSAADAPDYESRFRMLQRQWESMAGPADASHTETFQSAMLQCEQRLAEMAEAQQADKQHQARIEAARRDVSALLDELSQLSETHNSLEDSSTLAHLSSTLEGLQLRWQSVGEVTPAGKQQELEFQQGFGQWTSLVASAQALLDKEHDLERLGEDARKADKNDFQALKKQLERCNKSLKSFSWPPSSSLPKPPLLDQLEQTRKHLDERLGVLQKNQKKYSERIQTLLKIAQDHLEQERTREADRAHRKIRRILKSLTPSSRQAFEKQLGPVSSQLHEAHDWQDFAIEPKKVALCASMSALIGTDEDVEILALKIQTLQKEWKQLGGLPHAREQELWLKFKAAADEAWLPCKAAFSEQARQQRKNLEQRMQLVSQLNDYEKKMAWPDSDEFSSADAAPDWPLVQKTLDTARAAFRAIKPLSPKGERESQKAFRAICDRIYAHIKSEYERNITRKNVLVNQAEGLAGEADLSSAIDTAKKLQREWKETGMTPVTVDRKLWKSFRAACDVVFARLDEQRAESRAAMNEQVQQADALRDQAKALLDECDDEAALGLGHTLVELKQQVYGLDLPSAVRQRLAKDFTSFESQARETARAVRLKKDQAIWDELLESLKACATEPDSKRQASEFPEQYQAAPKGVDAAAIQAFWQQGPDEKASDAHRDACIRLEILGEIDSPAADKKARMNLQMQRLVQGLGSQIVDQPKAELDCINEFIALRPTADWIDRFWTSLGQIRTTGAMSRP